MQENQRVDQFLIHWQTINRRLRKGMLSEGADRITRLQWMLLRHVHKSECPTMGSLAAKFGVRPSTVSQMADRLEKAGLVERVSGKEDARQKEIRLTQKGEALIDSVKSIWAERLVMGLNQLSDEEQVQLIHLLERVAISMQDAQQPSDISPTTEA